MGSLVAVGSVFVLLGILMLARSRAIAVMLCRIGRAVCRRQRGFAFLADGVFEPTNASGALRFLGAVFVLQGIGFIVLGTLAHL
jgi:hypothetical protein